MTASPRFSSVCPFVRLDQSSRRWRRRSRMISAPESYFPGTEIGTR
jgi:hypothetical protein